MREINRVAALGTGQTRSYEPFESRLAAEIALFAFYHAKLSIPNITRLLQLFDLIPGFASPFPNADSLFATLDDIPLGHLEPLEQTVTPVFEYDEFADLDDDAEGSGGQIPASWLEPVSFRFYNIVDATQHLLARTDLADKIDYAPRMVFNYRGDRVVDNFMTGNYAHRIQVSLSTDWRSSFGNTDSGTAAENPPRRRNPPSYHCQLR
jgi:hypothetical protein